MADDERPDARDPDVAGWLAVDPLDDVTRRRLVSTALRETAVAPPGAGSRPSRTWRWIAAAAAGVVVMAGGLALLTADGGHDEQRASTPANTPKAADSATPRTAALDAGHDVGDFGDLDQPANLAKLRTALAAAPTPASAGASATESTTPDTSTGTSTGGAAVGAPQGEQTCGAFLPGATILAHGTGRLDHRAADVFLVEHPDGSRELVAVLADPCEVRHLP